MKEKSLNVITVIQKICLFISVVTAIVGVSVFIFINQELFNNLPAMAISYVAMLVLMVVAFVVSILKIENDKTTKVINLIIGLITGGLGIYIVLSQLIFDYFQPLSLFDIPIICFALFLFTYFLGIIFSIFSKKSSKAVSLIGVAMLGIFLITTVWANVQDYAKFNTEVESTVVFEKGEGNYATYRIPSVLLIEEDEKQNQNNDDILVVFAEARRDSALDYSISELVYKTSFDGGKTWTEMEVGLSPTELLGSEGRIADPTPVYNKNTDTICMLYQASTKSSNWKMSSYYIEGKLNTDGTIAWDKDSIVNVSEYFGTHFGPGPSKGTQLADGTLAFPIRTKGENFVITTNDNGKTWVKGGSAGEGGETDMASISDNEMVMICRKGKMSSFPRNNHLRFAYSSDNGKTWDKQATASTLNTPVCMSSVSSYNRNIYCAYADSRLTRANLSYAVSKDHGQTWETTQLYSGASGYAIGDITFDGDYYIIAEMGKVEYHEELRLFKIPVE